MGVSTSASLLVVFFGALVALGAVYTAGSNTTAELSDAYGESLSTQAEIQETGLELTAVYHEPESALTVRADNVGSRTLSTETTDVLVDGAYRPLSEFEISTVDDRETEVWAAGEQLRLETETAPPERVKLVTERGVAETVPVVSAALEQHNPRTLDETGDGDDSTIAFEFESSYPEAVTLLDLTVDEVDGADAEEISYDDALSEVSVTRLETDETVASAEGRFDVGETIEHDAFELGSDVKYRIGAFRDGDGEPVAMPSTTVTVTLTYEDPAGVERTKTFTEEGF